MGYSLSWEAVNGGTPGTIYSLLSLRSTGKREEIPESDMTDKHLSRDDAYMLSSVAADLHITKLVDGNKGVHVMLPRTIFVSAPPK